MQHGKIILSAVSSNSTVSQETRRTFEHLTQQLTFEGVITDCIYNMNLYQLMLTAYFWSGWDHASNQFETIKECLLNFDDSYVLNVYIEDYTLFEHSNNWQNEDCLVLYPFDQVLIPITLPPISGGNGSCIPLAAFPFSIGFKERILEWKRKYLLYYSLFLNSELEDESLHAIGTPFSALFHEGHQIGCEMEEQLGIPVYYCLYTNPLTLAQTNKNNQFCLKCGEKWKQSISEHSFHWIDKLAYRCNKCRIVSE